MTKISHISWGVTTKAFTEVKNLTFIEFFWINGYLKLSCKFELLIFL